MRRNGCFKSDLEVSKDGFQSTGDSDQDFGQKRPPVSVIIKGILERYPNGKFLKEMIQNADDAGDKTVWVYMDERQHGTSNLPHPDLARFQGPALVAANDALFTTKDWAGIQSLQQSEDPFKVGRFGIGFNSVYHRTVRSGGTAGVTTPLQTTSSIYSGVCGLKTVTIEELKTHTKVIDSQLDSVWLDSSLLCMPEWSQGSSQDSGTSKSRPQPPDQGLEEERLYKEAMVTDQKVSLSYTRILALGPGQVGKSTFLYRLMKGNIQTASAETQPQYGTGVTELREACITCSSRTCPLTSKSWQAFDKSSDLQCQLEGLMSLLVEQTPHRKPTSEAETNLELSSSNDGDAPTIEQNNIDFEKSHFEKELYEKTYLEPVATNVSPKLPSFLSISRVTYQLSNINKVLEEFERIQAEYKYAPSNTKFHMLFDVDVADIGGQPAFLKMLPSLTIGHALYLELLQGLTIQYAVACKCKDERGLKPCKNYTYTSEEVIFTALSSIACFGNSDNEVEQYVTYTSDKKQTDSLALLVGTFKDDLKDEKLLDDIDCKPQQKLEMTDFFNYEFIHLKSFLRVDNFSAPEDEIEQKRKLFVEILDKDISARWLTLSKFLNLLAQKKSRHEVPFDDCVKLDSRLGMSKEMVNVGTSKKYYFVPAVLQTAVLSRGANEELLPEPLCVGFKTGYLPLGFVYALSAKLIGAENKFELIPFEAKTQQITYKNKIRFCFQGKFDILMMSGPKYCELGVTRCSEEAVEYWDSECCPCIKAIVCEAANQIIQPMHYGSLYKLSKSYELAFKCPNHSQAEIGHESLATFVYDDSLSKLAAALNPPKRILCTDSSCKTSTPLSPKMKMWFGEAVLSTPPKIIREPSVLAECTKPLKYQGFKDDEELSDCDEYNKCTTSEFVIVGTVSQLKGMYKCRDKYGEKLSQEKHFDLFVRELKLKGLRNGEISKLLDNGIETIEDLESVKENHTESLHFNIGEKKRVRNLLLFIQTDVFTQSEKLPDQLEFNWGIRLEEIKVTPCFFFTERELLCFKPAIVKCTSPADYTKDPLTFSHGYATRYSFHRPLTLLGRHEKNCIMIKKWFEQSCISCDNKGNKKILKENYDSKQRALKFQDDPDLPNLNEILRNLCLLHNQLFTIPSFCMEHCILSETHDVVTSELPNRRGHVTLTILLTIWIEKPSVNRVTSETVNFKSENDSSDCFCVKENAKDTVSNLWSLNSKHVGCHAEQAILLICCQCFISLSLIILLLLLAGDVETNPGPRNGDSECGTKEDYSNLQREVYSHKNSEQKTLDSPLLEEAAHEIFDIVTILNSRNYIEMFQEAIISLEDEDEITFMHAVYEMRTLGGEKTEATIDTKTFEEEDGGFNRLHSKETPDLGQSDPNMINDEEVSAKGITSHAVLQGLVCPLMKYSLNLVTAHNKVHISLVTLHNFGVKFQRYFILKEITIEHFPDLGEGEQQLLLGFQRFREETIITYFPTTDFLVDIQQTLVSKLMRVPNIEQKYDHLKSLPKQEFLLLGLSALVIAIKDSVERKKTLEKDISKKVSARSTSWNTSKIIDYHYGNDSLLICLTESTEIQREYTLIPYVGIHKSTIKYEIVPQEPSVTEKQIYELLNAVLVGLLSSFKCHEKCIKEPPSVQSEISNDKLRELFSCCDNVPGTCIQPLKYKGAVNIDTMLGVTNVEGTGKLEEQQIVGDLLPCNIASTSPPVSSEAPISSAVEKETSDSPYANKNVSSSLTAKKEAATLVHSPSAIEKSASPIRVAIVTVAGSSSESSAADEVLPVVNEEAVGLPYPSAIAQEVSDSSAVNEVNFNLLTFQQSAVKNETSSLTTVQKSSQSTVTKEVANSSEADNKVLHLLSSAAPPVKDMSVPILPSPEKGTTQQPAIIKEYVCSPIPWPQAAEEDTSQSVPTNDKSLFSAPSKPVIDGGVIKFACFPPAEEPVDEKPALPSLVEGSSFLSTDNEESLTSEKPYTLPKEVLESPPLSQEANSLLNTTTGSEEADSLLLPLSVADHSSSAYEVSTSLDSSSLFTASGLSQNENSSTKSILETYLDNCSSNIEQDSLNLSEASSKPSSTGASIVSLKPKVRRKRIGQTSKQLYTLKQLLSKSKIQCTESPMVHSENHVIQQESDLQGSSKQARQRAALRRPHSPQPNSDTCIELYFESSSSCSSSAGAIDTIENKLISFHQVLTSKKETPTQTINIGSNRALVSHNIHFPTDTFLCKGSQEGSLAKYLTSMEMTRLQAFPTPTIVCVDQNTTPTETAKMQVVQKPCLVSNGKVSAKHKSNFHRLRPKVFLVRGKKGKKVKIITLKSETSSDYSNSRIVHGFCSSHTLQIVKAMQTPTSEYTGSSLHGILRRSNETSLEHLTESQQGSSAQQSSASHTEQSLCHQYVSPNLAADHKESVETNLLCEEEVKQDPLPSSKRLANNVIKPNGHEPGNTRTQGNPRQSATPVRADGRNPLRMESDQKVTPDYQQINVEAARECVPKDIRSATSGRHTPEWISAVTQLLHVPDYSKMIQRLNSETPTPEHYVSHRFIRGIAYFKTGKFQQAMRDLAEGETHAQEINQRGGVSLCCVYLGDLYYSSSSYSEAAKCYQKAADYHTTDSIASQFRMVPPTLSVIHAKCGSCFRTLSKTVEAIQEYKKAINSAIKEKDRLTAHTSLGNLYQSSGQNSEALKEYEEALKLAEKTNDHISVAWTHGNIGNAHLGLGMKDKALHHLQKALDLTIRYEPTPSAIGRAYNNIGTSYQSMGDLDLAEEHYDLALSQAIYGNDPAGQARVYGNIGNIFIVRKLFEKAIPHYSEVLRLSTDEATVTTALHNRGCAYYEWAESKMAALEKSLSEKNHTTVCTTFRIHGSKSVSQEHSPRIVIDSIFKLYKQGKEDLEMVLASHERKLDHIKGSTKGLSLTVSLFESNSRTFHRLQDCMVNLGNWREALLVAEQSRARTLGEMMLSRKGSQLDHPLTSPLSLEQVFVIVSSQSSPVLYLSHTGASILGWVIVPIDNSSSVFMEMFEVPLSDDQFDGKSFDYHVRYNLTEILVEQSYEMYCSVEYSEKYTEPVVTLYELIGRPLRTILNKMEKADTPQKIVLIADTYTTLLPFASLYDPDSKTFLGGQFRFELALSFLTIWITNQLPDPVVELPADAQNMCIVGNPTIPQFYHHNEVWSLGKLPYAKREAQWVGHILNTPPILDEQATKSAVLMRLMRAKVIHIATHGSSVSGFLAFSALTSTRQGEVVDSSSVLLHPEEVEKLSIHPALVVLSSCDSARGTVKADGIQGMARAFILAGAQAVMTALWRVPDESAAVFMRFFYRFLGEGFESSLALQKSILSLRCFAKYSQYIHWSGYQLTGRSIRFDVTPSPVTKILEATLGKSSVFPRLMLLKKLQSVLVENPRFPTDVQILHGSPGVRPSEVAIDFIHSSHESFAAGVYWINCRTPDLIDASVAFIEKVIGQPLNQLWLNETQQALLVLDNAMELPSSHKLLQLFKHSNVHIIALSKFSEPLDPLIKEVDKALIRGCKIHEVKTLSTIDSTQRTVYEIFTKYHLAANNEDQKIFEKLAEFTSGSPVIVDIAIHVLLKFVREYSENPSEGLIKFSQSIQLNKSRKSALKSQAKISTENCFQIRAVSRELTRVAPDVASIPPTHTDVWESESEYDSWDSIAALLNSCISFTGEMLLLRSLAIFGCSPVPLALVTTISSLIAQSSGHSHLGGILHERLMEAKLLKRYPLPVVLHSSYTPDKAPAEPQFVYMPQHIASHLWTCDPLDQAMAVALTFRALKKLVAYPEKDPVESSFYLGLISLLEEKTATLEEDKKQCFGEVYGLYLKLSHQPLVLQK